MVNSNELQSVDLKEFRFEEQEARPEHYHSIVVVQPVARTRRHPRTNKFGGGMRLPQPLPEVSLVSEAREWVTRQNTSLSVWITDGGAQMGLQNNPDILLLLCLLLSISAGILSRLEVIGIQHRESIGRSLPKIKKFWVRRKFTILV